MENDIPLDAFHFRAAPIQVAKQADDDAAKKGPRKCSGNCYSGDVLSHRWWGSVIFDLASTKAPDPTPFLIEHDRNQRAGFGTLSMSEADGINIADGTLMDNDSGKAVAAESDAGFPWQMSVHIEPGSIEELKAGTTSMVNGRLVQGPATIFRNNLIREVSFTPTGVDANTSAAALSSGAPFRLNNPEKDTDMDVKELQAQVDELRVGLKASQDATAAAEKRASDAEAALAAIRTETRMSAVKELFSATGREYTEDAGKPYMAMDDATFSAVSNDMKAASKPGAPSHLFSEHATSGKDGNEGAAGKFSLNPNDIYAARRKQA